MKPNNRETIILSRLTERPLFLLQLATAAVFWGRAWQHLYWDAPYRVLFWDENLMKVPVSRLLGMDWGAYVTDPATDAWIAGLIQATGWLYVLCGLAALLLPRLPRLSRPLLYLGGFNLVFLAFLYAKEHAYLWAQFFEYSLQFGSPFFLLVAFREQKIGRPLLVVMKLAVALTFACHGLFAAGVYSTPGYFVEMVMRILGLSQAEAVFFLRAAGVLDWVAAVLLFFTPALALPALGYTILWGAATTMARTLAYVRPPAWEATLAQWLHETVMRFPHFLIPLLLFVVVWSHWKEAGEKHRPRLASGI